MKIGLSLAQWDIRLGDPLANLEIASSFAVAATKAGSHLLLLPELWATGYDLENWPLHATTIRSGMFAKMAALARQHKLAIGGSLLEKSLRGAYNTFTIFNQRGELTGHYRKIHLFRLMDEHLWLLAGKSLKTARLEYVADHPTIIAGMAICYDLRFPELFRAYALAGVSLTLLVAEWPAARLNHWRTLLRARAIENQCFIAAVNCVGESQGELFGGHSAIIDPWGEVIAEAGASETLLTAIIDLEQANLVRQRIPIFNDRRSKSYRIS